MEVSGNGHLINQVRHARAPTSLPFIVNLLADSLTYRGLCGSRTPGVSLTRYLVSAGCFRRKESRTASQKVCSFAWKIAEDVVCVRGACNLASFKERFHRVRFRRILSVKCRRGKRDGSNRQHQIRLQRKGVQSNTSSLSRCMSPVELGFGWPAAMATGRPLVLGRVAAMYQATWYF